MAILVLPSRTGVCVQQTLTTKPISNTMNQTMIKKTVLAAVMTFVTVASASAEDVKGRVVNTAGQPVVDVVVTCSGSRAVRTDADGNFDIKGVKDGAVLNFRCDGYYNNVQYLPKAKTAPITIHLVETSATRYNESVVLPLGTVEGSKQVAGIANINRKDFSLGSLTADKALKGELTGLNVINKSGMTGEGAYLQMRGIRTLLADNAPLIVVNGVPYMPDLNESSVIGGYSRSAFQALNGQDIRNITLLKGAEAAVYGSMGSNGVIMIETDQATSDNMNTRISFNAVYGRNWNNSRIPLMNAAQYKNYISDMGLTYYPNMEQFFNNFTFLTDPASNKAYLYKFDTNWQDELFKSSSTMDYLFRVEGGDAIAKYNISLGYMGDNGTIRDTHSDRYNAQINASVLVSKQFEIQAAINAAYLNGKYQEQGLSYETNPLLAAYRRAPILSPFASDMYGNTISSLNSYHYGAIVDNNMRVSNPTAIVNSLNAKNRQYDLNGKLSLIYRPLANLSFTGTVGMYYNYNQEEAFIPGVTTPAIVPLMDQYGEARNTVRIGTNHTFNMFYGVTGNYDLNLTEKHKINIQAGFQSLMINTEYDASYGRNTNGDFYQTMGDTQALGRNFSGYNNKWNWLNVFARAEYTFDNLFKVGVTSALDGSSSIGVDATRMSLYPAVEGVLMLKRIMGSSDMVNKLNLYGNYTSTGNSRFSSKLGQYYYTSTPYQTVAGIIRANLPNTELKAERDNTLNLGIETSLFDNRLSMKVGYYNIQAKDVIMVGNNTPVLGTSEYYCNDAKMESKGAEISIVGTPVYTDKFKWTIGANLTTLENNVISLGNLDKITYTLSDGAEIVTEVASDPYSFYGYQTKGVFATTAEAESAGLVNKNGVAYSAGDVHYVDQNNDGIINEQDKVLLGSAAPTAYGSFFTRLEYKNFALDATFAYSYGNKAYNAVRRITESGLDFSNQSTSVIRRWSMEGQVTDMPRVIYGDPVGNNDFSDRWIENGGYLKLRDITLSYTLTKPLFNFIQGATVYVTGQNLITFTKYLGLDPEFSYSNSSMLQGIDYGKVNAPRAVKLGINLKF